MKTSKDTFNYMHFSPDAAHSNMFATTDHHKHLEACLLDMVSFLYPKHSCGTQSSKKITMDLSLCNESTVKSQSSPLSYPIRPARPKYLPL